MFALYVRRRAKPSPRSRWRKDRISFDLVATSEDYKELLRLVRKNKLGRKNIDWIIEDHDGNDGTGRK